MEDPGNGEPGSSLFLLENAVRDGDPSPKRKRESVGPVAYAPGSDDLRALTCVYSKTVLGFKVLEDLPRGFLR